MIQMGQQHDLRFAQRQGLQGSLQMAQGVAHLEVELLLPNRKAQQRIKAASGPVAVAVDAGVIQVNPQAQSPTQFAQGWLQFGALAMPGQKGKGASQQIGGGLGQLGQAFAVLLQPALALTQRFQSVHRKLQLSQAGQSPLIGRSERHEQPLYPGTVAVVAVVLDFGAQQGQSERRHQLATLWPQLANLNLTKGQGRAAAAHRWRGLGLERGQHQQPEGHIVVGGQRRQLALKLVQTMTQRAKMGPVALALVIAQPTAGHSQGSEHGRQVSQRAQEPWEPG